LRKGNNVKKSRGTLVRGSAFFAQKLVNTYYRMLYMMDSFVRFVFFFAYHVNKIMQKVTNPALQI